MKKKVTILIVLLVIVSAISFVKVLAQDRTLQQPDSGNAGNLSTGVQINPISLPFFKSSLVSFDAKNASIWSWLSFAGSLLVVALLAFWIGLMIRAGVKAMQSQGAPDGLAEAGKQAQSVLIGAAITLAVPIALSIVGAFLGIGNIFQWPKMFSKCDAGYKYDFYFQSYLANGNDPSIADQKCSAQS